MFGGDRKKGLEALEIENGFLREQISELKEEKRVLTEKLDKAYDALVAKESPVAYADRKFDESQASMSEEDKKKQKDMKELTTATGLLMEQIEGPIFRNVEDIENLLSGIEQTGPPKLESVHKNEES